MSNLLEQLKPVTTLAAEYAPLIADAMTTEKLAAGIRGFTMNLKTAVRSTDFTDSHRFSCGNQ